MRITAGIYKGKSIKTVDTNDVRPTSSKVRESIFNILQSSITGSVMLDLFAGSGIMGFEALSRGASKVVFVEKNSKVIRLLKENIDLFDKNVDLLPMDSLIAVKKLNGQKFDIIFVDPPYRAGLEFDICSGILENELLSEDGLLIVEHLSGLNINEILSELPLISIKTKKYGDTTISIYEKK